MSSTLTRFPLPDALKRHHSITLRLFLQVVEANLILAYAFKTMEKSWEA